MKQCRRLIFPIALFLTALLYFYPVWKDRQIPFPGHLLVSFFSPWKDTMWPGYPAGVPRKDLLGFDTVRMMGPWRRFITQEIKQGRLPTWNPYQFAGTPLLANFQSALFFPPNLIYLILPFHIAWTILVILQPILATTGMFLLLNELRDPPVIARSPESVEGRRGNLLSCLFAAVVYGFSAWMSVWIEWNIHGFIYALLPWVLLFIYRRKTILTILTISTIIFSGHPQMALIALTAVALFAIINRSFKKFLLSIAIALIITSIQWVPTIRYYREANREQSSSEFVYEKTLLPWKQLPQLLAPNFFGNPATGNFSGAANFVETTAYSGIAILGFALISVIKYIASLPFLSLRGVPTSGSRTTWQSQRSPRSPSADGSFAMTIKYPIILLLLVFIFSLPNPISLLIGKLNIPILSTSVASRWLILWPLATILLAAAGINDGSLSCGAGSSGEARSGSAGRSARRNFRFHFPAIFISILIGVLWITALISPPEFRSVSLRNLIIPSAIGIFWIITVVVNDFEWEKLFRSLTIVSRLNSLFRLHFPHRYLVVLLLISLYELVIFGHKTMTYTEKEFIYPSTPIIKKLQELSADYSRFASTPGSVIESNFATYFGLYDLSGYDALYPRRIGELVWAANNNGQPVKDFSRSTVVTPTTLSLARDNLWNLAGVRWIINKDDMLSEHPNQRSNDVSPDFKLIWEEGKWQIYENTDAFPRAFFIENGDWIGDGDEIISRTLNSPIPLISLITPAEIIAYQPTKVKISVQARSDGYLVLTDTFYPGWKATVDGLQTEIFPAFHAFRAVRVIQGKHIVEFTYVSL